MDKYPDQLLPPGSDAIRLLVLRPGNFYDPINCQLVSAPFKDKPRYLALSYTWGHAFPDIPQGTLPQSVERQQTAQLPTNPLPRSRTISLEDAQDLITVNDCVFSITHNLFLALLHLRSPTHALTMWIDAICINQADVEELNSQVAMMSFIYRRALTVIAWIGTKDYKMSMDPYRSMSADWKTGQSQYLAASIEEAKAHRYSLEPDKVTISRIISSTYWSRLWVIQEVCLPQNLSFVLGAKVWGSEDLYSCIFRRVAGTELSSAKSVPIPDHIGDGLNRMGRLLGTRAAKHSDETKLENLIDSFSSWRCSETRDKIYGLLGLAHDITPYYDGNRKEDVVQGERKVAAIRIDQSLPSRKGRGVIKVDYSVSLYEVWLDVMRCLNSRTLGSGATRLEQALQAFLGSVDGSELLRGEERAISIVRASGMVHEALDQRVSLDLKMLPLFQEAKDTPPRQYITAIGYLSGEILEIGPTYDQLLGSFTSLNDWFNLWDDHYQGSQDMERLRRIDEQYMTKMIAYNAEQLARIRPIRSPGVRAWNVLREPPSRDGPSALEGNGSQGATEEHAPEGHATKGHKPASRPEVRICLGTGHTIALVPSCAEPGDVIVRFWNCNAAIVMRPTTGDASDGKHSSTEGFSFSLVGRADVADDDANWHTAPNRDKNAELGFSGVLCQKYAVGWERMGAVYVALDFPTLQAITESISTGFSTGVV
ncbi:heterokaryon incompatibility protein-domain-containing protein [Xylariomycetidae sp. FL2044]|nr:heterokaryon incompatibility protein-domain-containing protein [Xylariomycetidae sp. FL2044]